jgi:hypothetical protein
MLMQMAFAAYDPPGFMTDFDRIPGQRAQWSMAVSGWFDECVGFELARLQGQPCQFYNQLAADATVLRTSAGSGGRVLADPDALVVCAAYGGPNRSSDPTIGARPRRTLLAAGRSHRPRGRGKPGELAG